MNDPTKTRPRLSLLSLLLLVAVIGLGAGMWRVSHESGSLRQRIDRLQDEVGRVEVGDPTRLWVQPLEGPFVKQLQMPWRVWTPPGRGTLVEVELSSKSRNRRSRRTLNLREGESTFELFLWRSFLGDDYSYDLRNLTRGGASGGVGPAPPWIGDRDCITIGHADHDPAKSAGVGETLELFQAEGVNRAGDDVRVVVRVTLTAKPGVASSSGSSGPLVRKQQPEGE